jgi:hypothetical protein
VYDCLCAIRLVRLFLLSDSLNGDTNIHPRVRRKVFYVSVHDIRHYVHGEIVFLSREHFQVYEYSWFSDYPYELCIASIGGC